MRKEYHTVTAKHNYMRDNFQFFVDPNNQERAIKRMINRFDIHKATASSYVNNFILDNSKAIPTESEEYITDSYPTDPLPKPIELESTEVTPKQVNELDNNKVQIILESKINEI